MKEQKKEKYKKIQLKKKKKINLFKNNMKIMINWKEIVKNYQIYNKKLKNRKKLMAN